MRFPVEIFSKGETKNVQYRRGRLWEGGRKEGMQLARSEEQ